jgi:hypothetical protein
MVEYPPTVITKRRSMYAKRHLGVNSNPLDVKQEGNGTSVTGNQILPTT